MLLVKADELLEKKFNAVKLRAKCKFCSICCLRMVSKTLTKQLQHLSGLCREKMQCFDDVQEASATHTKV